MYNPGEYDDLNELIECQVTKIVQSVDEVQTSVVESVPESAPVDIEVAANQLLGIRESVRAKFYI